MTTIRALQTTLAAEHAAVYVYGVLGAQTSRSAAPDLYAALTAAYTAHRGRRDLLTRTIADLGADPVAAEPAYTVPAHLDTGDRVMREAATLVANTSGVRRRWAIMALNDAAVRVLAFRGAPEMLPGADEYTDR